MKVYDRIKPDKDMIRSVAKTTSVKAKDIVRDAPKALRENTQDTLASVKAGTTQLSYAQMQKSIKQGWKAMRAWLAVGVAIAVTFAQKNMRNAQNKLEEFQENLQKMQDPLQRNIRSGLAKTSDVIDKSTSKARSSIEQATTKAKELQDSWQQQSIERQRKRKRAKMAFRWGLIFGVALALLYSPIAGSEIRRSISKGWQQSSAFLKRNMGVWA